MKIKLIISLIMATSLIGGVMFATDAVLAKQAFDKAVAAVQVKKDSKKQMNKAKKQIVVNNSDKENKIN